MALLFTSQPAIFSSKNPKSFSLSSSISTNSSLYFSSSSISNRGKTSKHPSFTPHSSSKSGPNPKPDPDRPDLRSIPSEIIGAITDEWGEIIGRRSWEQPTKLADSDPPIDEDEWQEENASRGNGIAGQAEEEEEKAKAEKVKKAKAEKDKKAKAEKDREAEAEKDKEAEAEKERKVKAEAEKEKKTKAEKEKEAEAEKLKKAKAEKEAEAEREKELEVEAEAEAEREREAEAGRIGILKRCLVDSVYGTEFGFRAGSDVRAEVLELVNQLEAANPTPNPVEATELLDGNWVLLYTAFSELLPLLAAGATPFLKVDKISQYIYTSSQSVVNSTTLSNPFATFTFSATASFEVRSPSRIQVQFKEGTLEPPEIKSRIDLPENVDVFGQNISLSPLQQSLSPLQEAVSRISRAISGQPSLKIPIPGQRTQSWLLITYLDEDFRISRGDGGLFVLVREGSSFLYQ